ncbi:autotransporter outer membrane beta-barrel domain-containing protein [Bradyrhizobium sp. B124]|uniref:beta strand repeat-containing protein n=1 Tax=Bradyrhizobium sp. B124 TaxID=3140245 RepID=UPI00318393A9
MSSIGIAVVRQSGAAPRSAMSWLGSASLIALTAMLAFVPHNAHASNECGAPVGGVVTCSGSNYPPPGISYGQDGLTLILNSPNMVVQKTTSGNGAVYISTSAANINDIVVNALLFQSIQSIGTLANGISVANSGTAGNSIVRVDTGTVTGNSNSAGTGAVLALINNGAGTGNALITLNGGQLVNTGAGGNGAVANNGGMGNATVTMTGGSVSTNTGTGLRAIVSNAASSGTASVAISGGTVTTASGTGVLSQSERGSAGVIMTAGTLTVQGGANPALNAVVNNAAGTGAASIAVNGGTVTNNGSGDGLFANNKGTGTYNISITGGTVTGGSGTGAAIHAAGAAGGTITIGSAATVNAGASGIALNQTGGAATITTAGAVTGNINLGIASNVLDITGGTIAGNISGGGNSALKFDLGAGTFVYGAANSISGMNSVAMNSGSARIDGSLATNTLAVNGGSLIVNGAATVSSGTTISAGTLQLGNGGSSGSITGDVTNNGMLAFDRSDAYTFAGRISGSGAVNQIGSGTTVLTGNNSYTGGTTISAGTLIVNGDQSAATGLTTVQSGATLGGNGTIGGSVTVANGGTLSPGTVGNAPGTLTIQKDLVLNGRSVLNFNFGQANVVGGPLNDLTKVNGNLTLAGTLNVTASPGGSFNPGVYRVISYAGTLTNNGLAVGTIPSPGYYVQTSIANQVNLVNTTGVTLNFWDGTAGPKNNGVVNGGNGVWQNSAGNDSWTTADGAINAPYSNGSFAIFAGTAGTVTIDNSLGQVSASGMQFATDGYHLVGGAIALVGAPTIIRVGDGTTAGAGYVATIDNVLIGNSQLVKADLGTLVLNGLNTYTGGTAVTKGTLSISSDANLGASGTSLTLDTGRLQTTTNITSDRNVTIPTTGTFLTKAGTTLTLNGTVSGAGDLVKDGGGTLLFNGLATNAGSTTVAGGTLQAGRSSVLSALSSFSVLSGGTLDLNGQGQTIASLSNAGTVKLGGTLGTTLTVTGNYGGNGGLLTLNTALGNDASTTDRLVVQGGTSGTTSVKATKVGGLGAQTVEGIKIIDVAGASNGTFALLGDYVFQGQQAVVGGAYAYTLQKNGISTPADGDWYLRSSLINPAPATPAGPLYQPGVPLYENYAQVLLGMNEAPSLQQRVGNRYWGGTRAKRWRAWA